MEGLQTCHFKHNILKFRMLGFIFGGGVVKVRRLNINHLDNSLMKNSLSGEPDFSIFPFSLERFL